MITSRRSFIAGITAAFAAPAIVKASSLMPVRAIIDRDELVTRCDVMYGFLDVRAEWQSNGSLSLDAYSKRILSPMMNKLAEQVANDVMEGKANDAFLNGPQWHKVWLNEVGLIEKQVFDAGMIIKPPLVYNKKLRTIVRNINA